MIDYYPPLKPGKYFHIYNHASGNVNLFKREENYSFFLEKYATHVNDVTNTFAYCLLPNHFHILLQIKEAPPNIDEQKFIKVVSKKFSNLFSSYTQSFNKQQSSFGNLFMKRFKRKEIDSENYFNQVVFYIHNNPVHHGLVDSLNDWKFSSYHSLSSAKPTRLQRDAVINRFDNIQNFIEWHKQAANEKIALEMEFG